MDYRYDSMQEIIRDPKLDETHKAYRSRIWYIVKEFLKRDTIITQMFMVTGKRDITHFNIYKKLLFDAKMEKLPLELNNESNVAKIIVKWRLKLGR